MLTKEKMSSIIEGLLDDTHAEVVSRVKAAGGDLADAFNVEQSLYASILLTNVKTLAACGFMPDDVAPSIYAQAAQLVDDLTKAIKAQHTMDMDSDAAPLNVDPKSLH